MKKLVRFGLLLTMFLMAIFGCAQPAAKKVATGVPDTIRIGYTVSLSGAYSLSAKTVTSAPYHMWADEVNKQGGLNLSKYGKRIPVQLVEYDDRSETETAVRLYQKLTSEDKVDLLLPPWGTALHFAVAPIANKAGYPLIGNTVSSVKLREMAPKLPNFFVIMNVADVQMKAIVDFLAQQRDGGKIGSKVAILSVADLYGIENVGVLVPELTARKFEVAYNKSYPLDVKDLTVPLKQIAALNPDVLLAVSYPGDTQLITKQAMSLRLSPSVFMVGVGGAYPSYRDSIGAAGVEGVMSPGAWSPDAGYPGAKEFAQYYQAYTGKEVDRWAAPLVYASLQVLQQAVEKVGEVDRAKVSKVISSDRFSTVVGPVEFKDQFNVSFPGHLGQWVNGTFQVIAPTDKATVQPVVPKPKW